MKILEFVLRPAQTQSFTPSIERAVALGAMADRLGHAFLGGYTAAITALDPSLGPDERGALCATESGGGHPRAILTTLENGRLNGTKHFVSGGSLATVLLVVAKIGEREGRPELRVARIGANQPGVTVEQGAPLDFIPEVPHGAVTFKDAQVEAVLEGDGYERYLKPFRTIEDLHIFGAVLGCLVANGRSAFPQSTTEQLLGVLSSIVSLGREDPRSPAVHLALAGVLTTSRALIDSLDLSGLEPGFRERFLRDRPLLQIAQRVREARRVKAWETLSSLLRR
jgi:hypothetical protein